MDALTAMLVKQRERMGLALTDKLAARIRREDTMDDYEDDSSEDDSEDEV